MKLFIPICILFNFLNLSCSETNSVKTMSCKDFKNGKFEYNLKSGKVVIERRDSVQYERSEAGDSKYIVSWTSECEYILELTETHIEKQKDKIGRKYVNKIIGIQSNQYTYECKVPGIDFVSTGVITKVE